MVEEIRTAKKVRLHDGAAAALLLWRVWVVAFGNLWHDLASAGEGAFCGLNLQCPSDWVP